MNSMSGDFNMDPSNYESGAEILELLGSLSRLLIVRELIVSGTLTVSQLSAATHISEPMTLQHVRKLTKGNIVISERKGTRLLCRVENKKVIKIIDLLGLLY
jgi:DNA-binding transcriptional ArsR family regulator